MEIASPSILISAVMPCLNEEKTLGICIEKAFRAFANLGVAGEVVVADNGSTDGSVEIAQRLGARVVHQPVKGYGAALQAGCQAANGKYIVMGDSDDSYDWEAIGAFLPPLENGADLVMGNRFKGGILPGAMPPLHRYLGNPVLSFISRVAFRVPIGDFHCGMRAFRKDAFEKMRPQTMGMEFATELIAAAASSGLSIKEIPIKLHKDKRGRPPHLRSWRDGWRHLRFIVSYAPDHLYMFPALAMLALGLPMQVLLFKGPFESGDLYLGIHFLALGGLLTLLGFNLLTLGVLAKLIVGVRYPLTMGHGIRRFLRLFTLERGLILGALLTVTGFLGLLAILIRWWRVPGAPMADTVHPAFGLTQACVLGVETVFISFLLHLLLSERQVDH